MIMRPGLVSVTFRKLTPRAIVELAAANGLTCLEWGGDVHVPHGDVATAREVGAITRERGLVVRAYGSYYALGESEGRGLSFEKVLETAVALGAPTIRVWPGKRGSATADAAYRETVASDALRVAGLAKAAGLSICYEFHGGSLTDTAASARALLEATSHPAIFTLWQPPTECTVEECLAGLDEILPRLGHVHAFHWRASPSEKLPLAEGASAWKRYLARMQDAGKTPDILLEFIPGDDPEILPREAQTLRDWLAGI